MVIRFAGDSGDGVQITGSQFTDTTALAGNDLATFPDFPAEIRAPVGTTFGVSAFQINFGTRNIETSGDAPDVLVALNPAALKVNLGDLKDGGLIILDVGAFNTRNYEKAGWASDPLEDDTLAKYRVVKIDISKLTLAESVKDFDVTSKEGLRCKNFLDAGSGLLALRSVSRRHDDVAAGEVREDAAHRRSEYQRAQCRTRIR